MNLLSFFIILEAAFRGEIHQGLNYTFLVLINTFPMKISALSVTLNSVNLTPVAY